MRAADAVVRVFSQGDGADTAGAALTDLVVELLGGVPMDRVRLGRRCPQCAGTDHGRPVVVAPPGSGVHVSIARTSGRTAVAGSSGPIGVDLERLDAERFEGVDTVALDPDRDGVSTLSELATQWVRKEAVLKATGWGVAWGPARIDVTSVSSPFPVTVTRSGRSVRLWVSDLPVGTDYAAAVAVVSRNPPRVLVLG